MTYKICDYEIELIQERILQVAIEIKRICEKHNISYVLDAGTLLGAIRHNGFIPWDDDLDIAMTRENYELFLDACKTDLGEDFFVEDDSCYDSYPFDFCKVMMKNTVYQESWLDGLHLPNGVYVDVFPIDNVKENSWKIQGKLVSLIRNARWSKLKHVRASRKKRIISFPLTILPLRRLNALAKYVLNFYNSTDTGLVCKICHPGPNKPAERKTLYTETISHKFEDVDFSIPKEYEVLLTNRYGDYMKLPPEEQRVPRHGILEVRL